MKKILVFVVTMLLASATLAQQPHQNYDLKPFTCPPGQVVKAFNPATIGYPGWFCHQVHPSLGGLNGTFTCVVAMTVSGGIVLTATSGSSSC